LIEGFWLIIMLMRGIEHEWHGKENLCCAAGAPRSEARQPSAAAFSGYR
jgi:hypothetical protein